MLRTCLVGSAMGLFAIIALAGTPAMATPCTNLQSLVLEHSTITSVSDVTTGVFTVPDTNPPQRFTGLPPFCRVTATLMPTSDSVIKIEVWLPEEKWNGFFLGTGGGGFQGIITYNELATRIRGGYAAANTDLGTAVSGCDPEYCGSDGNKGNALAIAGGDPANPTLGLFGQPERIKDFGHRAIHLMTVRGKEIVNAFYQQSPRKAFFAGCSTGGQNALMEAQRFPNDYDGIVAGDPAFNHTTLAVAATNGWQNTHASPDRFIQTGEMSLINKAVLAQCVGQAGGVGTDQFLTDPRDCHFDPKALQCKSGNVPPACLTAEQVTTMQHVYAGAIDTVTGKTILPGVARGSETDDLAAKGLLFREQLPEPSNDGPLYWVFGSTFGQAGSAINFMNFDIHRDLDAVDDRLAEPLDATNPDLSAFRKHGGKLIMYHGWADPRIPSQNTIDYFNAVVAHDRDRFENGETSGQTGLTKTGDYARLFMVPGMFHCVGGPGPNSFDPLTALVTWVDTGVAPETIIATKFVNDTPPAVQMTRPLCVFPKVAKFNGSGSTDDAANFSCIADEPDVKP
jgi:feruloyl esterase